MSERFPSPKEESQPQEGLSRREVLKGGAASLFAFLAAGNIKKAEAFLSQEDKEKSGLKFEVEIFYAPHGVRGDAQGLKEKIQQADVFAPELIEWTSETQELYRQISMGKLTPEKLLYKRGLTAPEMRSLKSSFTVALLEALYDSKKPVMFFDLPQGHPAAKATLEATKAFKVDPGMKFEGHITYWKEAIEKFAEGNKIREQYMLEQIAEFKKRVAAGEFPELGKKDGIKILLSLGAAHTTLYHDLAKDKEKATRSFLNGQSPVLFSHFSEAYRRKLLGKEVSDQLVGRAIFEALVEKILEKDIRAAASNGQERIIITRRITETFSDAEIKQLGDFMVNHFLPMFIGLARRVLLDKMAKKGIKIPSSKEELAAMLHKRRNLTVDNSSCAI